MGIRVIFIKLGVIVGFKIRFSITVFFLFSSALCVSGQLGEKNWLDRALAKFAQSSWVVKLNQGIAELDAYDESNAREAPKDVQELGKMAQLAVGVPASRMVPIKEQSFGIDGPATKAMSGAIVVEACPELVEGYSVKRCNMYHSAVSIKYNDGATIGLMNLAGFLGGLTSGFCVVKAFKPVGKWKLLYPVFALTNACVIRCLPDRYYRRYFERRADIEGHYSTGCHVCVHEKAEDVREALKISQDILDEYPGLLKEQKLLGKLTDEQRRQAEYAIAYARDYIKTRFYYLSSDENEQIASDLRRKNKVCPFHVAKAGAADN